jgi:hypothetical protein
MSDVCSAKSTLAATDLYSRQRERLRFANSYTRMSSVLALVSAPDFWSLLGDEWTCCDNIASHAKRLTRLFEREKARNGFPICAAMLFGAAALYDTLPDVVTVWRGCYAENRRGFSWTLNAAVAGKFPFLNRYMRHDGAPAILVEGRLRRDDIAFLVTDREEDEVVALPSDVMIVSEKQLIDDEEAA